MGLLQEFKEFAVKGNALDMAVGIILGAAFNKVVSSMVNDIIMPPIGVAMAGVDFRELKIELQAAVGDKPAVGINIGSFLNTTIDFLIVAFTVFVIVKAMNKVIAKRPAPAK